MSASGTEQFLADLARPAIQEVTVAGSILRPGSRVRLKPRCSSELLILLLAGRTAVIEGIDEDDKGVVHVAVIIENDPGWDLGGTRHPAHRFFFSPDELEPVMTEENLGPRVLVAGVGNVFLGDDGFGVAVAQLLSQRSLPAGVDVTDFGIRGLDLAYALGRGYDAAIVVDAVPRGGLPGTIYLMEPDGEGEPQCALPDGHRIDPVAVLGLAGRLGALPRQLLVLGCEPGNVCEEWHHESAMRLSPPVARSVERAADMVMLWIEELLAE